MFDALSPAEWIAIQDTYDFDTLEIFSSDFRYSVHPPGSPLNFAVGVQIPFWISDLSNRLIHARLSWVMLIHYFNKGVPNDPWMISPGPSGESVKFFPNFTENDFGTKALFNYFADMSFYKLYSSWDTLGQILGLIYNLQIPKPDFHKSVEKLKTIRPTLHAELQAIIDSPDFGKMKELRHDTTHSALPSGISETVGKITGGITFGAGTYTPSEVFVGNSTKAMDLFAAALTSIRKQIAADT